MPNSLTGSRFVTAATIVNRAPTSAGLAIFSERSLTRLDMCVCLGTNCKKSSQSAVNVHGKA